MCVPNHHTSCFTMSEACSRLPRVWGSLHTTAEPLQSKINGPQALAKAVGERAVGWQHGRGLQKQRPKAELRALGTGKLRPVGGESLGGLWRELCRGLEIRPSSLGSTASGENRRTTCGPWVSILQGTILSSPQPASSCGWGLWAGLGWASVFGWPSGFAAAPWGRGGGAAGPGETAFFGVLDGAQSHSTAEAVPRPPSPPQWQSQGSWPTLPSTHLLGGFGQTTQLSKSQYSHPQNGNTKSPLKVFL